MTNNPEGISAETVEAVGAIVRDGFNTGIEPGRARWNYVDKEDSERIARHLLASGEVVLRKDVEEVKGDALADYYYYY